MADIAAHHEQSLEHEGASQGELLIEAARRDNTELLQEVIDSVADAEKLAILLNETKTVLGNHIYHEAALRGNYDIIDMLLDQDGFECDPVNRVEGDTPLHSAIRYINELPYPQTPEIMSCACDLINMMIEAGSDPRIKNKADLTPYQLTDPRNEELRRLLQDAIDVEQNRGDYVLEDDVIDNDEEADIGSASDSDFDPEEHKREVERRKQERLEMNASASNGTAS